MVKSISVKYITKVFSHHYSYNTIVRHSVDSNFYSNMHWNKLPISWNDRLYFTVIYQKYGSSDVEIYSNNPYSSLRFQNGIRILKIQSGFVIFFFLILLEFVKWYDN